MDWNDLRHVLALARTGSARAAAGSLGVSHSTVVRRVESLEQQLSTRLFDRNRDGYVLTAAGRKLLPRAEQIEREVATLQRDLLGRDERLAGPVVLTCCDNYVARILLEELTPLVHEHPDIELGVVTDSRPFDLSRREADIAIRTLPLGQQPPEHLIGRKVAPVISCNYAGHPHPQDRWLSFSERRIAERMIADGSYPDRPAWGSFSCMETMVSAARAGLGTLMLPTYVGDLEPALQPLPQTDLRHLADLWLLSHADLRDNARFRLVRRSAADALKRRIRAPHGSADRPLELG